MRRPLLVLTACLALLPAVPASAAPVRGTAVVCPSDRLPPLPFRDLRADDVAAGPVACVLGLGVARGRTSTTYGPGEVVTRGQMAVFLSRVAERAGAALPSDGRDRFNDLAGAPAVVRAAAEALADADVVRGYGDGTYRPALPVRRDQMASFLVRLQQHADGPAPAPEECFTDTAASVHRDAVGTLCALGVVQGSGDGRYSPAGLVTRSQMAAFLARLLDVDAEAGLVEPLPPVPAYEGTAQPVDPARMTASHRDGCPVPLSDLRLLQVRHWGFEGRPVTGELVVHADAVAAVLRAFGDVYAARVPVERMRLVDEYGADDDRSMAANNTSAYNCRTVAGTTTWSRHAYGRALDVNPVQNPYVQGSTVEPAAGRDYLDRSDVRPGMAVAGGPVVEAFRAVGWGWGGDFSRSKDWQHFSSDGR